MKIIQTFIGIFILAFSFTGFSQDAESKPDPTVDYHYYKSGIVNKSKKDYKAAVIDFNIFLKYNPTHQMAIYFRGYCYMYQQEYENAIKDFEQLMEMDPTNIDGSFGAAKTYYQQGDYENAVKYYRKSIQLNQFHVPSYNDIGMTYCAMNKFDQALNSFYKAIEVDSSFAMAYCNAGAARYFNQDQENPSKRDLHIAKDWFTKALERDNMLYLAYYNRAAVNYFLGLYEESIDDLNYAILLEPRKGMNYFYTGVIYNEMGKSSRAISEFNKAIKLQPNLPFPYELLGDIYKESGEHEKAIDYYTQASNTDYQIGESYDGLMQYKIASIHALNKKESAMHTALQKAKALKVFEYRKLYNEFMKSKEFMAFKTSSKMKKFIKEITKAKKTGDFLDTSLRWFRMQQGTYNYKEGTTTSLK